MVYNGCDRFPVPHPNVTIKSRIDKSLLSSKAETDGQMGSRNWSKMKSQTMQECERTEYFGLENVNVGGMTLDKPRFMQE